MMVMALSIVYNSFHLLLGSIISPLGFVMKILRGLRTSNGVPVKSWQRQDLNITMMATTRATTSTITIKTGIDITSNPFLCAADLF